MASPFRPATALLKQYAEYHRDKRNIATHLVGVPMIVFGIGVLLARVRWEAAGGGSCTLAALVASLVGLWYLTRGHWGVGLATTAAVAALTLLAHTINTGPWTHWLGWGLGTFVLGWVVQFVGHWYEGRKPAFADDLVGLLVGPMFVVLEIGASLGAFKALMEQVEAHAGPTHVRDMAQQATP
jgi:uncharacterized membrane protein YGL010W